MNCYMYAVGFHQFEDSHDPGYFSGKSYSNKAQLENLAKSDGLDGPFSTFPGIKMGSRIVACRTSSGSTRDYHWFRYHGDRGIWSHKPGDMNSFETDADQKPLNFPNAPQTANFDFSTFFKKDKFQNKLLGMASDQGWAINYDEFVGYWYCPFDGLQKRRKSAGCTIL